MLCYNKFSEVYDVKEDINVYSEIGKLRSVILHRPGWELETITPDELRQVLFEDIPWLKKMQQEHDCFAQTLRENNVRVIYLAEMLSEVFKDNNARKEIVDYICDEEIQKGAASGIVREFIADKTGKEFLKYILGGIDTDDIGKRGSEYKVYLNSIPNLYFTRDMAAVAGNGIIISVPQTKVRFRESILQQILAKNGFYGETSPYYERSISSSSLECGDILVLNSETLCIGVSERTKIDSVRILAERLFTSNTTFSQLLAIEIPHVRSCMHLDTVLTMADFDKFVVYPGIIDSLQVTLLSKGLNEIKVSHEDTLRGAFEKALKTDYIKIISSGGNNPRYAAREQWNDSTNTIALSPGKVITYDRNEITNELLDKEGIKVITIPGSELVRGRGGPRCMSMPLDREDINQ